MLSPRGEFNRKIVPSLPGVLPLERRSLIEYFLNLFWFCIQNFFPIPTRSLSWSILQACNVNSFWKSCDKKNAKVTGLLQSLCFVTSYKGFHGLFLLVWLGEMRESKYYAMSSYALLISCLINSVSVLWFLCCFLKQLFQVFLMLFEWKLTYLWK